MAEIPDPDLLQEAVRALTGEKWPDGEPYVHLARVHAEKVAGAVLATVGRVLGERLDGQATALRRASEQSAWSEVKDFIVTAAVAREEDASLVRTLCGTPLPTEGGGGQ